MSEPLKHELVMSDDPSSPRYQMGLGVAALAAIAITCGLAVMIAVYF